tara:strand:+ start:962 stop:1342 length:381 start_codon:yes stop_codon:yes gene_type:complete
MAGKIIADTLEHSTAGSLDTQYVVNGSAKAWINFNGQNTPAARDSFNISTLTDVGTGVYEPNFSSAMSNANYATTCGPNGGNAGSVNYALGVESTTTTKVKLRNQNGNGGEEDNSQNNASIHGDLA